MPVRLFTDSEEAQIANIYLIGNNSARAISIAYGCTGNTILYALHRQGIDTSARYVRKSLYHFNKNAFDEIDNPLNAYWLGFIYADGHVREYPPTLIFNLSDKDENHLRKLNTFLDSDYPIRKREVAPSKTGQPKFMVSLHITDAHFTRMLRRSGIVTGRIDMEAMISAVPKYLLHHFVRGLFDGDGCAVRRRPEILFCGSLELMNWLRNVLFETLGTNPNKTITQAYASMRLFYLSYGGRLQLGRVADWMYQDATVYLERKKQILDSQRG